MQVAVIRFCIGISFQLEGVYYVAVQELSLFYSGIRQDSEHFVFS